MGIHDQILIRIRSLAHLFLRMKFNILSLFLKDEYPWVRSLDLFFHNFQSSSKASVTLYSVAIFNAHHNVHFIDMSIVDCNLTGYHLNFNSSNSKMKTTTKDQELFEGHPKQRVSRDDIKQLNISSTRLSKEGNNNDTSINIFGGITFLSYVRVTGVHKTTSTFIVQITREAKVFIHNCSFSQNSIQANKSGIFYIEKESAIAFHDSVFSENKGSSDVVISAVGSTVNISNCIFNGNTADTGGVINARNVADFNILNSEFINNTAYQKGIFIVNSYKRLSIYNSTFLHNTAEFGSVLSFGIFALEGNLAHSMSLGDQTISTSSRTILLINCIFEENRSTYAPVFDIESKIEVKIANSDFRRNQAKMGSVIQIAKGARIAVHNTIFSNNTGNQLFRAHHATLSLSNCLICNHLHGSKCYPDFLKLFDDGAVYLCKQ